MREESIKSLNWAESMEKFKDCNKNFDFTFSQMKKLKEVKGKSRDLSQEVTAITQEMHNDGEGQGT